ncbi:MAG: hypothetical protein WC881_04010, partial [Elusimicrobiota bacterium]
MRIVSFQVDTLVGPFTRLGALWKDCVLDLNFACAARLAAHGRPAAQKLADTLLPPDAVAFLELGGSALDEARLALEFVSGQIDSQSTPAGPRGERIVHGAGIVKLLPPLQPRSLRDFFAYEDHALQAASRSGSQLSEKWYEHPP